MVPITTKPNLKNFLNAFNLKYLIMIIWSLYGVPFYYLVFLFKWTLNMLCCGIRKKKLGSRESGRKIKWQLFATTFFSMVAIYYSFQDSAGKLEASLGQRINEKDLVSTSAFRPAAGSLWTVMHFGPFSVPREPASCRNVLVETKSFTLFLWPRLSFNFSAES